MCGHFCASAATPAHGSPEKSGTPAVRRQGRSQVPRTNAAEHKREHEKGSGCGLVRSHCVSRLYRQGPETENGEHGICQYRQGIGAVVFEKPGTPRDGNTSRFVRQHCRSDWQLHRPRPRTAGRHSEQPARIGDFAAAVNRMKKKALAGRGVVVLGRPHSKHPKRVDMNGGARRRPGQDLLSQRTRLIAVPDANSTKKGAFSEAVTAWESSHTWNRRSHRITG